MRNRRIELDFGNFSLEAELFDSILPGGIAYSSTGNYLCIFFGQDPAWPVEYIGKIEDDQWKILNEKADIAAVTITGKNG
jgi:hypothetical protein